MKPIDIQKKEFNKAIRGYAPADVDLFMNEVAGAMEELLKENEEMKSRLKQVVDELDKFNRIEQTLRDALVVAQGTAEDVVRTANDKADHIVAAAEHKAEKILDDANNRIIDARREYEEAKKDAILFKTRFKTLLTAQLEAVEESLVDDV